jgi:hypothetical protein
MAKAAMRFAKRASFWAAWLSAALVACGGRDSVSSQDHNTSRASSQVAAFPMWTQNQPTAADASIAPRAPEPGPAGGAAPAATCTEPTRFPSPDPIDPDAGPQCLCAENAYPLKPDGPCACQSNTPTLCHNAGQPAACVDIASDWNNCGACGRSCFATAPCNQGACGAEPSVVVPSAPGCIAMRITYDAGRIYWSDLGDGSIRSMPAVGQAPAEVTSVASGVRIAAMTTPFGALLSPANTPIGTALLARAATVYWIGADDVPSTNDAGTWLGGAGTTIWRASVGAAPELLLPASLAPGPSPVSAVDAGYALETPGVQPPINAIGLSPDGGTLYFAAGTRYYAIPSSGATSAGDVRYVGGTRGPEGGVPMTIVADDRYIYSQLYSSGHLEMVDTLVPCDSDAGANATCPLSLSGCEPNAVFDVLVLGGNTLFWGNGSVIGTNIPSALAGTWGGEWESGTLFGRAATGFAVGSQFVYFGEDDGTDGYIEKAALDGYDGAAGPPSAILVARGQRNPGSFAFDGANVYWTTSRCDINAVEDMQW